MKTKIIGLIIALIVATGCGTGVKTGTGKKIGQVIQIGAHGMMCDTYEGKLVRGGFNTGSGVAGGTFEFTVLDEGMFKRLEKAMELQQEIEVDYRSAAFSGVCTTESGHYVTGFRVLNETTPTVVVKPLEVSEKERKRAELQKQLDELK